MKFWLIKQHLREALIFCFNWRKRASETHGMLAKIYSDAASTYKSWRNSFNVSRMVITTLKASLALDSRKKFEDKDLETLLSWIEWNAKRSSVIIMSMATDHFRTTEIHENDKKQRNWVPRDVDSRFFAKVIKHI